MDVQLQDRDALLAALKQNLHLAQSRMKRYYDKHHTERVLMLVIGFIWSWNPISVQKRLSHKLSPRFYGLEAKIGQATPFFSWNSITSLRRWLLSQSSGCFDAAGVWQSDKDSIETRVLKERVRSRPFKSEVLIAVNLSYCKNHVYSRMFLAISNKKDGKTNSLSS